MHPIFALVLLALASCTVEASETHSRPAATVGAREATIASETGGSEQGTGGSTVTAAGGALSARGGGVSARGGTTAAAAGSTPEPSEDAGEAEPSLGAGGSGWPAMPPGDRDAQAPGVGGSSADGGPEASAPADAGLPLAADCKALPSDYCPSVHFSGHPYAHDCFAPTVKTCKELWQQLDITGCTLTSECVDQEMGLPVVFCCDR